jgi:hypothetical protein
VSKPVLDLLQVDLVEAVLAAPPVRLIITCQGRIAQQIKVPITSSQQELLIINMPLVHCCCLQDEQ